MLLQELLTKANININNDVLPNISLLKEQVTDITANSRLVQKGSIFVAVKGRSVDGNLFIEEALKREAIIVFAEESSAHFLKEKLKTDYLSRVILVNNTKEIINKLCSIFYNNLPKNIVMITGTNGKTSTANMVVQILENLNIANAQIGTTGIFFNGESQYIHEKLTTPQVADLFKILKVAKESNINYVAIEASSEGIEEGRLNLLPFSIAAFTNLSQDHLNYHKNMENYFKAKAKLFTDLLPESGIGIINKDDEYGSKLLDICQQNNINTLSYGKNGKDLELLDIKLQHFGYIVTFCFMKKEYKVELNLLGEFQVYNLLCAILIVLSLKVATVDEIIKVIPLLKSAKGRLELIREYNGAKIFVDYAHTPAALELSLQSLRKLTIGKLYVIFGCGGERDKTKRAIMGEIANINADFSYITDDNPRGEDPQDIRKDIIKGFSNNSSYLDFNDREEAIVFAIKALKEGDTLLVAGKGHEEVQIVKDKSIEYSDIKVVLSV